MIRLLRLAAVSRKEIIQLRRDPRSLGMAFVVPALLILLFGYVISFDVREIRLGVLDQDRTMQSRSLVEAFESSGYFSVTERPARYADAAPLLDRGAVRLVLVIPPDFARTLASGAAAPVQALVDGGDANTAAIALNYAGGIVTAYSARAVLRGLTLAAPVVPATRIWYNEELKSSDMVVPGLVAVIMMIIAAMLTALTVAREWERGTMEQLAATPVHRVELILGKLLPYVGIGMIDVAVSIAIGRLVFAVPFRGSLLFLFVTALLFLVGSLGLGIFISSVVKSQLLASQMAMLATYLPSLLLSGLIFDIAGMPVALRYLTTVVPARYFVAVLRGVFLKGVGPGVLWPQAFGMALFAAIGLTLAVRAFHKEIG